MRKKPWPHRWWTICGSLYLSLSLPAAETPAAFDPPKDLGPVTTYGRRVQRTMRLLATSKPEQRHTVRILFYGQSITEQGWTRLVADDLRRRFPDANLVIENRAIGGHASQLLVKTAEADLYPFYPDLLIFHVYGAHNTYEDIIRRVRERTTAEILIQNDHITQAADLTEEMDPAKLQPRGDVWNAFMNHKWLPYVAQTYQAELCDQRAIWKQYLRDYQLAPAALLRDGVHLNARGEFLMAECVKAYLRYDPSLVQAETEDPVKTLTVGRDVSWSDGKLRLDFTGNRVDAVLKPGGSRSASIRIDGRKPSEFPELYQVTRVSAYPGMNWPVLLRVQSQQPLRLEDWTVKLREISADAKQFKFVVTGSQTGVDGEGDAGQRFVSKSGRVVIVPEDWNLAYARSVQKSWPKAMPLPEGFEAHWRVVPLFADEIAAPAKSEPATETTVTVAQGLKNAAHHLEISGGADTPIAAIRVYRPASPGRN